MSMEINEMQEMNERAKKALEYHKKGYNCSQAVACSFCEEFGVDEETMFRMTEGLGLGMGGMEGTCGAVTAACVIAGAKNSTVEMGGPGSKGATYKISKEIVRRFKEESCSVICKELKGVETGTPVKACPDCVKDAARILEEVVFGE